MPVRIPPRTDLHPALVLAHADRGHQIHERRRIRVRHVRTHRRRIIGGIPLVRAAEVPGQLLRSLGELRLRLELDVDVRLGALLRRQRAVRVRHPVIEHHHVVLYHPQPLRFRILAGADGILLPLQRRTLLHVRVCTVQTRLLVVPQYETDRDVGLQVGHAEHARQFHHQRRARSIVVRRLAPAQTVHVTAHDVHLVGVLRAHLRAVDLLALTRCRLLSIQLAKPRVGLPERVAIHTRRRDVAAHPRPAHTPPFLAHPPILGDLLRARALPRPLAAGARTRRVFVRDPLGRRAPVALQLLLDPVHRRTIAIGALLAVAELREPLDRGLVALEREPRDHVGDLRVRGVGTYRLGTDQGERNCEREEGRAGCESFGIA